ncbi:MAG: hypothetical protein IPG44_17325 [Anaerolineales bacterium]|nr:hypothetical protein [Anaerolineales bacterium]
MESDEIPEANNILSATLNRERERSPERENILRNRLVRELELVQQAIRSNKPMQELYDAACDALNLRDSVPFKALTSPSFALRQSRVGADGEVSSPEMRAPRQSLKGSPKEVDLTPQELTERVAKVLLAEVNRKGMDERLKALRLFRYVGGDKTQTPQDGWAPYTLSLRTAEARRAARLLSESLRMDIFQPLVQQYADFQGKENELKDEILHKMAEQAKALREAYLLETENERAVGRWVEVEWGKRLAHQEEKRSNWQGAVSIWKGLDNHYPGVVAVKRGLQNARIQDTINRAYYMVHNDHKGRDALALLKALQAEPDMSNSWELNLALAETYETLGEFDSAFGNLDQIERVTGGLDAEQQKEIRAQVERKRAALESQQVVYTCIADAKNKMTAGYPIEALRMVIQEGIENPKVTDPTSLQDLRDDIFNEASQELLSKTKIEQDKGTGEGKIQAVIALVDLQTLEDLIGQPIAKRRSTTGLNRLRNDLASVASTVILAAGDFDPTTMPLMQAISTASAISAQLQTFDNVTNVFNAELEPVREKLTRSRRNIASILSNLQTLEKTLKDSENQSLWESAILTGDFEILKQYLVRINKLDLNEMPEVRAFDKRLSETQEAYHYLLNVIGQIRHKFSVEEDFGFVKDEIVKNKVQPPYRENTQAWQIIHAKEYEYIHSLLDDRVRVPDVYGRNDLVGWQKALEQAEEREKELELWQEWERKCYQNMDSAERAVKVTETQPVDMPTRNKKMDWEKVLEAAQLAISALTYPQVEKFTDLSDAQEKTRTTLVVGVRDIRDVPVPVRSKAVKNLEEDGKRRKSIADQWVHTAQTQIEALQAILDKRGFPSADEFKTATSQSDWDPPRKFVGARREAGITNENERQVDTLPKCWSRNVRKSRKKDLGSGSL